MTKCETLFIKKIGYKGLNWEQEEGLDYLLKQIKLQENSCLLENLSEITFK